MQQHVGDLLGYASSNRAGDPVYCVDCAAELFPDTTHFGTVRSDPYTEREVFAILQEE